MRCGKPPLAVDTTADLRLLGDSAEGAGKDEVVRPGQVETLGDDADISYWLLSMDLRAPPLSSPTKAGAPWPIYLPNQV